MLRSSVLVSDRRSGPEGDLNVVGWVAIVEACERVRQSVDVPSVQGKGVPVIEPGTGQHFECHPDLVPVFDAHRTDFSHLE